MEDRLAIFRETSGAIRHQTLALSAADRLTQIGFTGAAEFTFTAFWSVQRNDVITHCNAGNTFADCFYNPTTFMAEDHWEYPFGIFA